MEPTFNITVTHDELLFIKEISESGIKQGADHKPDDPKTREKMLNARNLKILSLVSGRTEKDIVDDELEKIRNTIRVGQSLFVKATAIFKSIPDDSKQT